MNDKKRDDAERDDNLLSAYLDGELPEDDADRLTVRLASEPALARRLAALRGADQATRALYDRLDDVPMPDSVVAMLDEHAGNRPNPNVVPFRKRLVERYWQAPVAIAASVALVAGFLLTRTLDEGAGDLQGIPALAAQDVPAGSDMHALLETGRSAETVTLADGSEAQVVLTFADTGGDWCRELRIYGAAQQAGGVACRREGRWRTEVLAFGQPSSGGYQPASGGASPAVAATVDRLMGDSQPLDNNEESATIRAGWKKN